MSTVTPFACGSLHPEAGVAGVATTLACERVRNHAGDHRAECEGLLVNWADLPLGVVVDDADDVAEEWEQMRRPPPFDPWEPIALAFALVALVLFAAAVPGLLLLLYRQV